MKKYLFIALAALGFAACAEKIDDNSPVQKGELEESYIAINLMSADVDTRASVNDNYGYEYGTEAERAIKNAYFFFFKDGSPFYVNTTDSPATAPGYEQNYLKLNINRTNEGTTENVSDISEAVLVLSAYKGYYPNQIVAVLNWTPSNKVYTLEDLHTEIYNGSLGNDTDGYVMTNSVYMDGSNKMVDATPIAESHIKKTPTEAIANPVDIYVERTAAKIVLTSDVVNNMYNTEITSALVTLDQITNTPVYVKLHGWELYNDYTSTNLLKNIDVTWSIDALGLTWNDSPYFRSYWADSQAAAHNDSFAWSYTKDAGATTYNGYPTQYGFKVASLDNNDNIVDDRSTYTYCGENTNSLESGLSTKVILKGQLMQEDGDGGYTKLELARWYGNEYAGVEGLKRAVANSLNYTLFYHDGSKYVSIAPEHLECVADVGAAKEYEVGFQLSTTGEEKTWYLFSSESGYQPTDDIGDHTKNIDAANQYLANNVKPALLYESGNTYYIVDIEHLGATGKPAKYGVVRNHVYQIEIESIKGYGSPYFPGFGNIENPEYPEIDETSSYVSARINVLSWKVVKQGVNVGQ